MKPLIKIIKNKDDVSAHISTCGVACLCKCGLVRREAGRPG